MLPVEGGQWQPDWQGDPLSISASPRRKSADCRTFRVVGNHRFDASGEVIQPETWAGRLPVRPSFDRVMKFRDNELDLLNW
jgi:hypothetical protein